MGQTALVILVPEAEAVVGGWRERYDPASAEIPPHVTVFYPFFESQSVNEEVDRGLEEIFKAIPAFELTFAGLCGLPGVLYLAPEPGEAIERLIASVGQRFPELEPYGGAFDEVIPHLTIAITASAESAAEVAREADKHWEKGRLPFSVRVGAVELLEQGEAGTWLSGRSFALGGRA
jgi:2'-5' RNA ligase